LVRQLLILGAALVLLGLVLILIPARGESQYRDALSALENALENPESLEIVEACYDDERVIFEFYAETEDGTPLEADRAGYYYTGNMEGALELYTEDDLGHGFFRCREDDLDFPAWLIGGRMGPRNILGILSSAGGAIVFAYALYKYRKNPSEEDE